MSTNILTIVLYVVLVLAVLGGIGAVAYFTSGFTSDFQTFYLTKDDVEIFESIGGLEFEEGKEYAFEVKYTFGKVSKQQTGYSIEIAPYIADNDFEFYVDGESHWYSEVGDLTKCFDITCDAQSFTLTGRRSMAFILSRYYEGKPIEIPEPAIAKQDYYIMTVYSYNQKASVKVMFHATDGCDEIIIDPDSVVL